MNSSPIIEYASIVLFAIVTPPKLGFLEHYIDHFDLNLNHNFYIMCLTQAIQAIP